MNDNRLPGVNQEATFHFHQRKRERGGRTFLEQYSEASFKIFLERIRNIMGSEYCDSARDEDIILGIQKMKDICDNLKKKEENLFRDKIDKLLSEGESDVRVAGILDLKGKDAPNLIRYIRILRSMYTTG